MHHMPAASSAPMPLPPRSTSQCSSQSYRTPHVRLVPPSMVLFIWLTCGPDALVVCATLECNLTPHPPDPLVRIAFPDQVVLIESCSTVRMLDIQTHLIANANFRRNAPSVCVPGAEASRRISRSGLILISNFGIFCASSLGSWRRAKRAVRI